MTQVEKDHIIKQLKRALAESDAAWKGGEKSFAWIIGNLEGAIKSAIIDIEFMETNRPLRNIIL